MAILDYRSTIWQETLEFIDRTDTPDIARWCKTATRNVLSHLSDVRQKTPINLDRLKNLAFPVALQLARQVTYNDYKHAQTG